MGCFCHLALAPLSLPSLNVSASLALPRANLALSLSGWLGARALPAAPWQPDPNWLSLLLPKLGLNAGAMATVSALAQLRAQVLAQFGIDLLLPGGPAAFARIVATLNLRLQAMATATFNPLGWINLAALNGAIDQINLALQAGLLPPSANLVLAMTTPGGVAMPNWRALLAALAGLAPLIAAATHLGINLNANFSAQLAAALRILRGIALPALGPTGLMASLTAALSAVAQLQASLGVAPLALGFPAVQAMVSARLTATLSALCASLSLNLQSPNLLAELLALLPSLPYSPTSLATSAVIQAALSINAQALASLNWQVPALSALPVLRIGLPVCALAAQLQAALGISAVMSTPCVACDAAATMRALAG